MFKVLSSGSKGNAVLYHRSILVDCGVSFALLRPYLYDIQIVLLTHEHHDHINALALKKLSQERPTLRIGCCEWMLKKLPEINPRNIDVYEIGKIYNYGVFSVSPIKLYHDVPNCGYRIFKDGTKILHATDTAHLVGISAKDYDLYAIEHNYDSETVNESVAAIKARGGFAHQEGSINSHLSEQQARDFIFKNKKNTSQVVRLHETQTI